ncbi:serine-threonine protein kinase 19-domain-containing protein [Xylariales sp. AK1849]|nr:serine-threonine protein kinase 19-domain-containing protein [Xylariales sp. AK1849]
MSLRSILGGSSRVRKSTAKRPSPSKAVSSSPRGTKSKSGSTLRNRPRSNYDAEDEDYLGDDKLDDIGLVRALATDLNLRDTAQAIQYLRSHMFSSIPDQAAGMNSTRIAEVLNYRKRLPPIVTISHIQTLLSSSSAVEREVAELARSGFVRKIEVARRGEIGETVILAMDLEKMIDESPHLSESTKTHFKASLKERPVAQTMPRASLSPLDTEELFKAGFLTAHHLGTTTHSSLSNTMNLYSRPEDKTTLVSLERVSKQPTGTLGTVGGAGAVHMAGGSGGGARTASLPSSVTELRLAVPGNGAFLKLVSSALEHLVSLLGQSRFREAPESVLRERWDGGISKDEARFAAKKSRGEFAGILPGQTRKWKQFRGLSFDWVLQEAVGSGLVEVFETGSVGRGVRVI